MELQYFRDFHHFLDSAFVSHDGWESRRRGCIISGTGVHCAVTSIQGCGTCHLKISGTRHQSIDRQAFGRPHCRRRLSRISKAFSARRVSRQKTELDVSISSEEWPSHRVRYVRMNSSQLMLALFPRKNSAPLPELLAEAVPQIADKRLKSESIRTSTLGQDPKDVRIAIRRALEEGYNV